MNYLDKLNKLIDGIDTGGSEFWISLSTRYIRPVETKWSPNIEGDGLYENYIRHYAQRVFNLSEKKWEINREHTMDQIHQRVMNDIDNIFIRCSPMKIPIRTKIYKSFVSILENKKTDPEFLNSVFEITEYYNKVTATDSIGSKNNDVHRKNIFQLLKLMEKSYGKSKKSSNG